MRLNIENYTKKDTWIFLISLVSFFIIDQIIKYGFVFWDWGFRGDCLSFVLAYNYGVAFSMFSFLEGNLKYIQIALLLGVAIYLLFNKDVFKRYYFPISLVAAGGISNVVDRFVHGGVVDYVYWHCGFEFAIFNFADVIIDIGVVLIIYMQYKVSKLEKTS